MDLGLALHHRSIYLSDYYCDKQFCLSGLPISALFEIEADDYALVNLNGNTGFCDINSATSSSSAKCNVQRYLYPGNNSIKITATNKCIIGSMILSIQAE